MTDLTSSAFIGQPSAGKPATNLQRGHLRRLRDLSQRLRTAATFKRSSDGTRQGEAGAQLCEGDAAAIDWALRQLAPAETERQQADRLLGALM